MYEKTLFTAKGNVAFSNSWKQEIIITDKAVYGKVIKGFQIVKSTLPYDRIAQVNILRGMASADIEVINKGGSENIIVKGLSKSSAERVKSEIERQLRAIDEFKVIPTKQSDSVFSIADELRKLNDLKLQGIISEQEFQNAKAKMLDKQ